MKEVSSFQEKCQGGANRYCSRRKVLPLQSQKKESNELETHGFVICGSVGWPDVKILCFQQVPSAIGFVIGNAGLTPSQPWFVNVIAVKGGCHPKKPPRVCPSLNGQRMTPATKASAFLLSLCKSVGSYTHRCPRQRRPRPELFNSRRWRLGQLRRDCGAARERRK